jgi:hypothetical protein
MSTRADKFCDDLREKLSAIDHRITAMKAEASGRAQASQQAARALLDSVQKRVDARRNAVDDARAKVAAWADEKKSKFDGKVAEWKEQREARLLDARADFAESYAAAAFDVAVGAADEAELALLEASLARLDAESAAGVRKSA